MGEMTSTASYLHSDPRCSRCGMAEVCDEPDCPNVVPPEPVYADEWVSIYHGDWRDHRAVLSSASLIFADPPYHVGIDYASYDDRVTDGRSYAKSLVDDLTALCELVVITPGVVNLYEYPEPYALLVRFDRTQQSPARVSHMCKWEPVLVYGKPPSRLAWDVIETASQSERAREPLEHPVPKPIALLHPIIQGWTEPGDLIADPFMGSGTTLRASKNLGRKSIGVDIELAYCGLAAARLAQEVIA